MDTFLSTAHHTYASYSSSPPRADHALALLCIGTVPAAFFKSTESKYLMHEKKELVARLSDKHLRS
jgi:hypothetical protein